MRGELIPILMVLGIALAGCANSPPELVPGVDYIEGAAEVPEGEYLLVEFITEITPCGRGQLLIDFPDYEYENGTLSGYVLHSEEHDLENPVIGYFGRYEKPAAGLGSGAYSTLTAFHSLPFHCLSTPVTLLSIDSEGTVVADVNGDVVKLEVGESWSYTDLEKPCDKRGNEKYVHHFTNQGFLTEDQIDLN